LSFRADRLVVMRMNWQRHVASLLHENFFHMKYQMTIDSFNKLLDLLSHNTENFSFQLTTVSC
jgi:hypothetical protein